MSFYYFETAAARYFLFSNLASWTTAQSICNSRNLSLASWRSGNGELYRIFELGWNFYYAREFWVGVIRRANASTYEFVDGGVVQPIDEVPFDQFAEVVDTDCVNDFRGCCATLTDRMGTPFEGVLQTPRGPRLMIRNCLTTRGFLCRAPLPAPPLPPSPPVWPLVSHVQLRFQLDYLALTSSKGGQQAFGAVVAKKVADFYPQAPGVKPYDMYQDGNTDRAFVVHLEIQMPLVITEIAADTYLFVLINSPSIIFDNSFRAEFSVGTPILSKLLKVAFTNQPPSPPAPWGGTEQSALGEERRTSRVALGAGVGAGIGLAVLLAAVAAYVVVSRRRSSLRAVQEIH